MKQIAYIKKPWTRHSTTEYQIVDSWQEAFRQWFITHVKDHHWTNIAILSDENVWSLYEQSVREALAPLTRPLILKIMKPGESSKDISTVTTAIEKLIQTRVHRRDLLLCFGGGVCCDIGGLLALLYMRGIDYVNIPTSLMAQLDGAIGGKVGANYGIRKNLLGGFHHPRLVLIDPGFLDTLPDIQFHSALAEAVKVAVIRNDPCLFDLLEKQSRDLLCRKRKPLNQLIQYCLEAKLALLDPDPFELNLDRVLNFGHAVAHALERLPVMQGDRNPSHGEAVAIGIAAKARYAFRMGICSQQVAEHLLSILKRLDLPLSPACVDHEQLKDQIIRIPEHRGGLMRLVVPAQDGGICILPHVDIDMLIECVFPITELG